MAVKMRQEFPLMSNKKKREPSWKEFKRAFYLTYDTTFSITKASKRDLYQRKENY